MDHKDLARKILERSHLHGTFKLRSGQTSHEYFDKYRFESDPLLLREIADQLASRLPSGIDALAGLEMGGIPIATALSLKTGLPQVFVRKEAKTYGTCQFAEGLAVKGLRLCIVEDVVTTGGQVILSAQDLRKIGAHVEHVVCVIERGADARVKLQAEGLNLVSLFTKADFDGLSSR